jgi:hypothetical protein
MLCRASRLQQVQLQQDGTFTAAATPDEPGTVSTGQPDITQAKHRIIRSTRGPQLRMLHHLTHALPPAFRTAVTATASVHPNMAPNSAASTGHQPASAKSITPHHTTLYDSQPWTFHPHAFATQRIAAACIPTCCHDCCHCVCWAQHGCHSCSTAK